MSGYELIVIGGGPAGLSAAISARQSGLSRVLLLERRNYLGGILPQCIHTGFGLREYGEELTGPQYAARLVQRAQQAGVEHVCGAAVTALQPDGTVRWMQADGDHQAAAQTVVLASGCRERPIGALNVCGTRPAGILTAGAAQEMVNLAGYHVGNTVVILGSGDVGLIMARRLTLLGARVVAVVEQKDHCGGLEGNRKNCLEAYGIPLLLRHTVTQVHGEARITGTSICPVDQSGEPSYAQERLVRCDALITAVGLIPERDLLRGLEPPPWLFDCGNAREVHDLVDDVADDGAQAGYRAAHYVKDTSRRNADAD